MSALLPAVALAQVTRIDGAAAALVASRRSRTLHLQRGQSKGPTFTPRGLLRRGQRPVCGYPARRWRAALIDGRPLCRRCSHAVASLAPTMNGTEIARLVPFDDVLATVQTARTEHDVSAAQILATNAGYIGRTIPNPGGPPLRLTQLIGRARDRVTTGGSPLEPRDHAWAARRLRPVPRFPRRVR